MTRCWRPIRRPLGISGFAVNAYSAEAGEPVIEPHDETSAGAGAHQERYLVASGAAAFTIDGETVDASLGTLVAIEPGVTREAVATQDGTTIVVIGGRPGAALPPSPFEYWYSALPSERAGELEQAIKSSPKGLSNGRNTGRSTTCSDRSARVWTVEMKHSNTCRSLSHKHAHLGR